MGEKFILFSKRSHFIRYIYDKSSVKTDAIVETKKEEEKEEKDVNASKKEN